MRVPGWMNRGISWHQCCMSSILCQLPNESMQWGLILTLTPIWVSKDRDFQSLLTPCISELVNAVCCLLLHWPYDLLSHKAFQLLLACISVPCGPQIHLHLLQPTASADFSVYTHTLIRMLHVEADTYKHTGFGIVAVSRNVSSTIGLPFKIAEKPILYYLIALFPLWQLAPYTATTCLAQMIKMC